MPPRAASDLNDLESGAAEKAGGRDEDEAPRPGRHLRWAGLTKTVEAREAQAGLLRGSIAGGGSKAGDGPGSGSGSKSKSKSKSKSAPSGAGDHRRTILDGVSGGARPGEVTALMGPSGSGKTTLLDVLSGRSSYDSGTVLLDGEEVTARVMKRLKKHVAYVRQADLFFGHLTVRDQLTYTALLRLPASWSRERKVEEVESVLCQLRLGGCADTPIHMVSGGERKRVNIGSELLTDPTLLLLDEPTSGLDSTSAVSLMAVLADLAQGGGGRAARTVLTSIHQPSSAVFFRFDRLLLLADGAVAYHGRPQGSLGHVALLGMACLAGYNAADHLMDLLVVDGAGGADGSGGTQGSPPPAATTKRRMLEGWDGERLSRKMEDEAAEMRLALGPSSRGIVDGMRSFHATWWTQYTVLVHRSMKNSRSAIFTTLNLVKAGAIGLVCGLLWFQMPYTEAFVFDRSSYYFFTMTFWVFDAMFTAYMAFPLERSIIFKERASGAYRLSAYFLAKTTSEAPARLALPSLYMVISYWLSGLNNNTGIFLASTLCSLLSVLAGESIGLFLGAAVLDLERGMVIMTVAALGLMVVGGFFVREIPGWMEWMGYVSPFRYSYNASVQLVFDRPVPCDGSGVLAACGGDNGGEASVADVLGFLGVQGSAGFNAGMLLVIFLVMRVAAFYALRRQKAEERMA